MLRRQDLVDDIADRKFCKTPGLQHQAVPIAVLSAERQLLLHCHWQFDREFDCERAQHTHDYRRRVVQHAPLVLSQMWGREAHVPRRVRRNCAAQGAVWPTATTLYAHERAGCQHDTPARRLPACLAVYVRVRRRHIDCTPAVGACARSATDTRALGRR